MTITCFLKYLLPKNNYYSDVYLLYLRGHAFPPDLTIPKSTVCQYCAPLPDPLSSSPHLPLLIFSSGSMVSPTSVPQNLDGNKAVERRPSKVGVSREGSSVDFSKVTSPQYWARTQTLMVDGAHDQVHLCFPSVSGLSPWSALNKTKQKTGLRGLWFP